VTDVDYYASAIRWLSAALAGHLRVAHSHSDALIVLIAVVTGGALGVLHAAGGNSGREAAPCTAGIGGLVGWTLLRVDGNVGCHGHLAASLSLVGE